VDPPPATPIPPVLSMCVDRPIAVPGDQLVYHLQYANGGSAGLSGVVITDPLPLETRIISVDSFPPIQCTSPSVGSCGAVTCDVGGLPAGASGLVTIMVDVDPTLTSDTTITNTAIIESNETGQACSNGIATTIQIDTAP
jgi:uncharacterized repeat protein (TIGR01451 family)